MCTTFCEPSINFFWHGNSWWDLKRTDRAWSNADFSVWKRTIGTWNLLYPSFIIALFHWDHCPLGTSQTTIVPKGTIHTTLVQWVLLKLSIPHLSHGQLSTPYLACSMGDYPYHTCPKGDYSDHTYPMGDYPYRWPLLAPLLDEEEYISEVRSHSWKRLVYKSKLSTLLPYAIQLHRLNQ